MGLITRRAAIGIDLSELMPLSEYKNRMTQAEKALKQAVERQGISFDPNKVMTSGVDDRSSIQQNFYYEWPEQE